MGCSESTPIVEVDLTNLNAGDKVSVAGRCRTKHKGDISMPFTVRATETYAVRTNAPNGFVQRKYLSQYCDCCRGTGLAVESGMVHSKVLRQQSTFAMGLAACAI
mmetsp:Transcript_30706/g.74366  ORF Transcript_30706/g.74366 Transcript_30706/m.74366 type:complete len:105 (-) Transcript_30706:277-591(-)